MNVDVERSSPPPESTFVVRSFSFLLLYLNYPFTLLLRALWPVLHRVRLISYEETQPARRTCLWNPYESPSCDGRKPSQLLAEGWTLVRFAVSVLVYFLPCLGGPLVAWLFILRTFIYQANVLLFDGLRAGQQQRDPRIHGYTRSLLLLLVDYAEMIFWFGYLYHANWAWFEAKGILSNTGLEPLFKSWLTMVSMGSSSLTPTCPVGLRIVFAQSVIAALMLGIAIAMLVNQFPRRGTKDPAEIFVQEYHDHPSSPSPIVGKHVAATSQRRRR
jgi:hypothetical protein